MRRFSSYVAFALLVMVGALNPQMARSEGYDSFHAGRLSGKVTVQWLEPDIFLFIPDSSNPLTFIRSDGTKLVPGRMLTDGGSIPRPLRAFKNYSPWGYGPAFIVHDWLFHIQNCQMNEYRKYDLKKAGTVMAEIIKSMMESGKVERDPLTVDLMYQGVTSPIAQSAWDHGRCIQPPASFSGSALAEYTFDFGPNP